MAEKTMNGGGSSFTTSTESGLDEELNLEGLSGTAPIDPRNIDDVFDDDDRKPPATNQSHWFGMRRNSFDFTSMSEAVRGAISESERLRRHINNLQNTRPLLLRPRPLNAEVASFTASDFNCFAPMRSNQQLRTRVEVHDAPNSKRSQSFGFHGELSAVPSLQPLPVDHLARFVAEQPQQQLRLPPQTNLHHQDRKRQHLHSVQDVSNTFSNHEPLPLNWLTPESYVPSSSGTSASANVTLSVANALSSLHPSFNSLSGTWEPPPTAPQLLDGASAAATFPIANSSSMNSRFKQGMGAPPHSANVTLSFANASSMYPRFNNDGGTRGPPPQELANVCLASFNNNYFHAFHSSPPPPADVSVAADVAAYLRHGCAYDVSNEDESSSHLFLPSAEKNTSTTTPSKSLSRKRREKKTNDNDPNSPVKALTAYNFFFRFERDRLMEFSRSESSIDAPEDLPEEYFAYHAWTPNNSLSEQREMLENQWHRDRSVKRKHTKTHGRISFASLTRRIAVSWKALPQLVKDVFRDIARKDALRYARELSKYETTKQAS